MQVNSLIKRQNNWKSSSNEKGLKMGLPLDNYRLRILSGNKEQNITGIAKETVILNFPIHGPTIVGKLTAFVLSQMLKEGHGDVIKRYVGISLIIIKICLTLTHQQIFPNVWNMWSFVFRQK